jgi:Tfp pilus assembly protein PilF
VSEQVSTGVAEKSAKTHTELGSLYLESGNLAVALDEARLAAATDPAAPRPLLSSHLALKERRRPGHLSDYPVGVDRRLPTTGWFLPERQSMIIQYFEASQETLYKTPTRPYTNAVQSFATKKSVEETERAALLMVERSAIYHSSSLALRGDYQCKKSLANCTA